MIRVILFFVTKVIFSRTTPAQYKKGEVSMDENNNYNNNNYNEYNYNTPYQRNPYQKTNSFAKASLILGIASIATGILFLIPIPFITAILSIIFGFVSRQRGQRMEGKAIVGISLSVVTLITIVALFFVALSFLNSMAGVEFINQFMEEYSDALKVYMEFYK